MSLPSVSPPSKRTKEQSNSGSVSNDVDHYEVISDVVPLSMVPGHATPLRKPRKIASRKGKSSKVSTSSYPSIAASDVKNIEPSTTIKKPHSMTSLYLDPINVEPNVDTSAKSSIVPKVMGNVETSKNTNKHIPVTTLSKSSMIVAKRDNVDKNICVLISQFLGIELKTSVVPDVSTSLAQADNPSETPMDKSDENVSTQSPEKSEEKDDSDGMLGDLSNKEENSGDKKDQYTNIVNVDDLDSNDEPIGKRLAPGIAKRLKNRKGKAFESSSKPSKSLKRSTSVGPTKGWGKVVTHVSKKRSLKRKEVPSGSSESDCNVEHDVQDIFFAIRK